MVREQKDQEATTNHKNEDAADHSMKALNSRIVDTQKSAPKAEMMNGIDNSAFESEQL